MTAKSKGDPIKNARLIKGWLELDADTERFHAELAWKHPNPRLLVRWQRDDRKRREFHEEMQRENDAVLARVLHSSRTGGAL